MTALIFSHQRCGSSNLTRFVADATGVKAVMEPLNAKTLGKQMPEWREATGTELTRHFTRVLTANDVVKHIYGQHSADIDYLVASSPHVARILLMHRVNTDAAALSALVAKQLSNWNKQPDDMLAPISIRKIREISKEMRLKSRLALDICTRSGKPLMVMSYEQLFSADEEARKKNAEDVLQFLLNGRGARTPEDFSIAFEKFMGLEKKLGSDDTHQCIPNFSEIQASFPEISK